MESQNSQNVDTVQIGIDLVERTPTVADTTLIKHSITMRDNLQRDTFTLITNYLDRIFEFFNEGGDRDEAIKKLSVVTLNFCIQLIEYERNKDVFENLCRTHPLQHTPKDFDFSKEYEKLKAQEEEVTTEEARCHPNFIKFWDRVRELERVRQSIQTEAISVE